jgi:hypothetical protein
MCSSVLNTTNCRATCVQHCEENEAVRSCQDGSQNLSSLLFVGVAVEKRDSAALPDEKLFD